MTPQVIWSLPWRRAEVGGSHGHGNARGIVTVQSVLAAGGAFGKQLMSETGRTRVLEQQVDLYVPRALSLTQAAAPLTSIKADVPA